MFTMRKKSQKCEQCHKKELKFASATTNTTINAPSMLGSNIFVSSLLVAGRTKTEKYTK